MKKLLSLFVLTAIHYSALGNYLVDQDGHRVEIKGHPHMTCYLPNNYRVSGYFIKQNGATIWIGAEPAFND